MADFGNAGTIIVHDSEIAATVDVSNGQFLVCTLDVSGGVASFTFACTHHVLHTPTGPPVSRYQWTVFDEPNCRLAPDMHLLALNFSFNAKTYRFRMELFDENLALIKTLKDLEYSTTDPADVANEPISLEAI
jgi:hypothetical protein